MFAYGRWLSRVRQHHDIVGSDHRVAGAQEAGMLNKILIERFKSIRHAELEFGRVNVFIGGNGAGKTNLLEAIGVVSAALARGISDGDLTRKGVRMTPPELMKSAFKGRLPRTLKLAVTVDKGVEYRMDLTGRPDDPLLAFFSESCIRKGTRIFGRSNRGSKVLGDSVSSPLDRQRSMWDQVRTAHEFPNSVNRALDGLSEYVIYTPQTDFLRGVKEGRIESPPLGLRGEGLPGAVRGLVRQRLLHHHALSLAGQRTGTRKKEKKKRRKHEAELKRRALNLAFLPGWARSFQVGRVDDFLISRDVQNRGDDMLYFVDKFMQGTRNKLSAYDSSEGTLFLLFAAVVVAHDDAPQTFGFDNIDSALNPSTVRRLTEAIVDATDVSNRYGLSLGPKQVFLTSHHPSTLDAFDLFDDAQRVFVVDRNALGHTTVKRLQPQEGMTREDWDFASNGRRLSQLWMEGEIKGALGCEVNG